MQSMELENSSHKAYTLLPHQKKLLNHLQNNEIEFPFYLYWGMGSGKTFGGLLFLSNLNSNESCLILCDKSLVGQWKSEYAKFGNRNRNLFQSNLQIFVAHYEAIDTEEIPFHQFSMIILDEAHRFRNAWSRDSARMQSWIEQISVCKKIVYLSGTPIVNDADLEFEAFEEMMGSNFNKRIFYFMPCSEKHYASICEKKIECFMSWAQCFKYLLNRKQNFTIEIDEVLRTRTCSRQSAYNNHLRSIVNNPFPENVLLSPKFCIIADNVEKLSHEGMKQLIYSSRRDDGVDSLAKLICKTQQKLLRIDGSMDTNKRTEEVLKFNRTPGSILLITDAGGQGIDLKRVDVVHLTEPLESIQEEKQVINRAIRFKSHKNGHIVEVIRYICKFPKDEDVCYPWKNEIYKSGMFEHSELKGLTRKMQKALNNIIENEEQNKTLDERIIENRLTKEKNVQNKLNILREASI